MSEAYGLALNVLGYREDGEWCALALDMDLRGYGRTFEEALEELRGCVVEQIGFARFKNQLETIWRPAEPEYFKRFEEVRKACIDKALAAGVARSRMSRVLGFLGSTRSDDDEEYVARGLPIPPAHEIAAWKGSPLPPDA